jgi:hypothetical protein
MIPDSNLVFLSCRIDESNQTAKRQMFGICKITKKEPCGPTRINFFGNAPPSLRYSRKGRLTAEGQAIAVPLLSENSECEPIRSRISVLPVIR